MYLYVSYVFGQDYSRKLSYSKWKSRPYHKLHQCFVEPPHMLAIRPGTLTAINKIKLQIYCEVDMIILEVYNKFVDFLSTMDIYFILSSQLVGFKKGVPCSPH